MVLTVLHKYRMLDKDPALFYLTLELCEFSSCHTWFDCKFILRMKMGKEVIQNTSLKLLGSRTPPPSTFLTPACGEG